MVHKNNSTTCGFQYFVSNCISLDMRFSNRIAKINRYCSTELCPCFVLCRSVSNGTLWYTRSSNIEVDNSQYPQHRSFHIYFVIKIPVRKNPYDIRHMSAPYRNHYTDIWKYCQKTMPNTITAIFMENIQFMICSVNYCFVLNCTIKFGYIDFHFICKNSRK